MKILIVEDEALVAMSVEYLLKLDGHEIIGIAEDFPSVMAAIERERPDLALVDVQLAHGDSGLDVAAELARRGIPSIFATGNAPTQPCADVAIGCISKPFSDAALFGAVRVAERILSGQKREVTPPSGFTLYRQ